MRISEYIVDFLIKNGVSDIFGMPGGIILDLIHAADQRKSEITLHLNFHEQGSSLSAVGFSQASGNPCVSYSTRGPGLTNMITAMADAYNDSVPVIFITAHEKPFVQSLTRSVTLQEFDTIALTKQFTKCSERIESFTEIQDKLPLIFKTAISGRPGPVFIDFLSKLFTEEMTSPVMSWSTSATESSCIDRVVAGINDCLFKSHKPIILIGDGIRQSNTVQLLSEFANDVDIPILSSRFSQDILAGSRCYFGYIGSHGLRYSNFILSEADLIISIGNRLSFNRNSLTFKTISEHTRFVRIDCDENELSNTITNCESFCIDLRMLVPQLKNNIIHYNKTKWLSYCKHVKEILQMSDTNSAIDMIVSLLKYVSPKSVITSDVGNNELLLSMAYEYSGVRNRVLYSKSFGVLGCSLPKAIGAYYTSSQPVICFTGDLGLMLNIQELQHVSAEKIPIIIVLLNNHSSGMIKDIQERKHLSHLHTTSQSGYSVPDFSQLAKSYGITYHQYDHFYDYSDILHGKLGSTLIEINISDEDGKLPYLPIGNNCWDFVPDIPDHTKQKLNQVRVDII